MFTVKESLRNYQIEGKIQKRIVSAETISGNTVGFVMLAMTNSEYK